MTHRICEAMRTGELAPIGGGGGHVQTDEYFVGCEPSMSEKRAYHNQGKVLSPVHRATGQARWVVVDNHKPATVIPILKENIAKEACIVTDEAGHIPPFPEFRRA